MPTAPEILLEDGPLLAVNKPAGLLTQGVPTGLPTLEFWVKEYLRRKYSKPGHVYLGLPHRLDRPVSGVIVFARNSKAAARLAEQFRERQVRKWYVCLVQGQLADRSAHLVDWLRKDAEAAHVHVSNEDDPLAKRCELRYEQLATHRNFSLVRIELLTGRMHQIRVQLASRGYPIVGDIAYGSTQAVSPEAIEEEPAKPGEVMLLHAEQLELRHPIRYDLLTLKAPIPPYWHRHDCWHPSFGHYLT